MIFNIFKRQPKVSEQEFTRLADKVESLSKIVWQLQNPPKYKIGQRIKHEEKNRVVQGVVISIDITVWYGFKYTYTVFNGRQTESFTVY